MDIEAMTHVKILLIDDNPTNLGVLFDYLVTLGFTVLVAPDGERAFGVINEELPDIILLDIRMPGIDGFEVCRRLKEQESTKDIPVIFMTALSETEDKVRGFELGGVDYITKPFQQEEVLARVKAHLTIRRLQQQLQQQNDQLKELNAYKDKFFSIIAHDLRSPFNGLLGFTDIIVEGIQTYNTDSLREIMLKLQTSAKTLFKLLENLLTWSRIQRGMLEYHPQSLKVKPLVTHNVSLLTLSAEQKGVSLTTSIPDDLFVYTDPDMFDTVIRNLLSNSLKFTPPNDGKIAVSASQDEHNVTIAVSDTGIGIPAHKLEALFQIDTKYQRQGTAGEKGTGLGLILCKEMIEQNNGRIDVESQEGQGSTFKVIFPRESVA